MFCGKHMYPKKPAQTEITYSDENVDVSLRSSFVLSIKLSELGTNTHLTKMLSYERQIPRTSPSIRAL